MLEKLKDKKTAIIATLFAMFLWGSDMPVIKTTYKEMGVAASNTGAQILIAGFRFFLAGVLAFIYFRSFNEEKLDKKNINIKYIIILSLIQTSIQYIFYYVGMSNTSGVKSSIIQATNSFLVVIISIIMLPNEKINLQTIIAIILGTLGIIVVNGGFTNMSSEFKFIGEGFILIATTFNALSSVFVRKYGASQNEMFTTASQFIIGSIILIVTGLFTKKISLTVTPLAIILIIYGAFISATSYIIWNTVLRYHSANEMGVYKLFVPIFGSLLSVWGLHEDFTIDLLIGLILVILGSIVLNLDTKNNKKKTSV